MIFSENRLPPRIKSGAGLKPGTKIFIGAAKKQPDGTLQAARINYGKDGVTPPM
jgi:hypothetical protein